MNVYLAFPRKWLQTSHNVDLVITQPVAKFFLHSNTGKYGMRNGELPQLSVVAPELV